MLDCCSESAAARVSHARDIPPFAGSIIWIRQIERQLGLYMKRMEDVLGRGWENYVEGCMFSHDSCKSRSRIPGRQLKQEGDNFRHKLNTQHLFDDWIARVQAKSIQISGRLFSVEKRQKDGKIVLQLKVNFAPDEITLAKEVLPSFSCLNPFLGATSQEHGFPHPAEDRERGASSRSALPVRDLVARIGSHIRFD
jgi:dynein heavy chain 1